MAKSAAAAQEAEEIITTTLHWGDVSCIKYSLLAQAGLAELAYSTLTDNQLRTGEVPIPSEPGLQAYDPSRDYSPFPWLQLCCVTYSAAVQQHKCPLPCSKRTACLTPRLYCCCKMAEHRPHSCIIHQLS